MNNGGQLNDDHLTNGRDELGKCIVSESATDQMLNGLDENDNDNDNDSDIDDDNADQEEKPNLQGDRWNVALLTFLYFLQGIVSGLSAAMPLLLQNYGATYSQQAQFSMAVWPFSLKLVWAPIIDCLYSKRFGRRKSWLIPTQFLTGVFMLILSFYINLWLSGNGQEPNIEILTILYFGLNFLAASQDVTVDGWAVQMVKRRNTGYIATCNQCGQKTGFFVGFALFTALESAEFCNKYLRNVPEPDGLITMSGFLRCWGICFLCATILIAIFKHERPPDDADSDIDVESDFSLIKSYKVLFDILKLRGVKLLVLILLTSKFAYALCDNVMKLKLLDAGIKTDDLLILIMLSMMPTEIFLPLIVTKYTTGPRPTETYIKFIPFRLLFSACAVLLVWYIPSLINESGEAPIILLVMLFTYNILYDTCVNSMYLGMTAFFAKVSDPRVGGTYMTLWNTVENFGGTWPATLSLWMIDLLTWKECEVMNQTAFNATLNSTCPNWNDTCTTNITSTISSEPKLKCRTTVDGFYIEAVICMMYGVLWYFWGKSKIRYLQRLPTKVWRLNVDL
ncbi:acetyl-coenzyme A transporter 1-like [Bradysia coprophila]|uniref:acetyl-coenzyme A transporter 1-like n=1 Tax=Bradysia coprophila TaxID=38358 RepID=UPI00187DD96D|nr:acetyl-coenzyme A transporter 1-like [Bradysia coprophila]XP_037049951.1 acetyl-coenzyme A transporter 1-like [Bradysia coprophila]XP_037049952.1 acetyl-coenzyme A transporter 1-like [Bradysia coprophila]XP_037049954.1 acetyl-coenzyme A transporter 1-like [Bradysia coprophila]